ncbi:MAG: NlpC/P60 family protein [Bacteroidetes bacterium]|nr:MAG: NlpC/P60 family protein [Bacteroidota bacterium]
MALSIQFTELMNQEKINISVTGSILLMVAFPLLVSFWGRYANNNDNETPVATFDTLAVAGYTFFKNHEIHIDENSCIPLYNAVYPLMGIPHRSRAGGRGLDCSGFVKIVFNEAFGMQLKGSSRDIYRTGIPISLAELNESDLVFFTIGGTQINHVGIYLNNGKFVHTSSIAGVTINDLNENYYKAYFKGAARVIFE